MQPPRQRRSDRSFRRRRPTAAHAARGTAANSARRSGNHCSRQDVSGEELVVDGERAGVDVADGVDQAHHPAGAAQVQPGQRAGLAEPRQVEERVAGEHAARRRATSQSYSWTCWAGVGCSSSHTSAPRPDGRSRVMRRVAPYLSASALKSSSWSTLWRVTTTEILASLNPASLQVLQRADRHRERTGTAHRVVDLGGGTVQRDLHVDVVAGGQLRRHLRGDAHSVGGELDPDVVGGRVVDEFPEIVTAQWVPRRRCSRRTPACVPARR